MKHASVVQVGPPRRWDLWWLTGFGGSLWDGPFERVIGRALGVKNGTYLILYVRFPGDENPRKLMLDQRELRALLNVGTRSKKKGFPGHGTRRQLRAETDCAPHVAHAEAAITTEATSATADRAQAVTPESPE